jgi:hypothetical protein
LKSIRVAVFPDHKCQIANFNKEMVLKIKQQFDGKLFGSAKRVTNEDL